MTTKILHAPQTASPSSKMPPCSPDTWWDIWDAAVADLIDDYDLGWATFTAGRTVVSCWADHDIVQILLDRPTAALCMQQDAGLVMKQWIREAVTRWQTQGGVVSIPLPRAWRRARRHYLATHSIPD